ncbi:hypothetical protein RchiOBHm_Chr6g0279431 [Rosa chinensis]|uniref:Uncharacterized protein n=1 Tax=Rosa chinensis TaxID=74649 RepID=A0A2P6PSY9_ROSCH|nr:hypothetical protein RchiOBHm_Chr6g0279431 [Rosa chinensis]
MIQRVNLLLELHLGKFRSRICIRIKRIDSIIFVCLDKGLHGGR